MTKYSLSIGINNYPGTDSDLSGCVNDALDWQRMLTAKGYVSSVALLDSDATKYNITEFLKEYVAKLGYRDTLAVTYSGHGSWIPDADGDEADGRDEVLCAYDYDNGGLVTDDELYRIFDVRKFGSRIFMFSDSCHSGSVARIGALTSSRVQSAARARFLPPAYFLEGDQLETAARVENRSSTSKPRLGAILMSGCTDYEYSYDAWFNDRANGAFTKIALDTLHAYAPATMTGWHEYIRRTLPSAAYPQTPQLGGTAYQKAWMI